MRKEAKKCATGEVTYSREREEEKNKTRALMDVMKKELLL